MELDNLVHLVVNLEDEEVEKFLTDFINSMPSKKEALELLRACRKAMEIVGKKFENREFLIGDVIYAGELQRNIIEKIEPILGEISYSHMLELNDLGTDPMNIGEKVFKNILKTAGSQIATECFNTRRFINEKNF